MIKKYLEVGRIVGTHGIKGEVRIEAWSDSPDFLSQFKVLYLKEGQESIKVKCRPHKNIALAKIENVETIEQGEMLRGQILYIDRDDVKLSEGQHFIQDLIGCKIIDIDTKKEYGTLVQVLKTGANDVYAVKSADNKEYLVPVIDDVVIEKNVEQGEILIRPLKGLFDDED